MENKPRDKDRKSNERLSQQFSGGFYSTNSRIIYTLMRLNLRMFTSSTRGSCALNHTSRDGGGGLVRWN